jgi:hypothetical protein
VATSPVPDFCAQRGVSFLPSNGVAARERSSRIDEQIADARQQAEKEARKFSRTRKTSVWGR